MPIDKVWIYRLLFCVYTLNTHTDWHSLTHTCRYRHTDHATWNIVALGRFFARRACDVVQNICHYRRCSACMCCRKPLIHWLHCWYCW